MRGRVNGSADNIDPVSLGKSPREFNIQSDDWSEAEQKFAEEVEMAKVGYAKQWLEKHLLSFEQNGKLQLPELCESLLLHCQNTTKAGRDFLEENPNKRIPADHVLYPGKMDHTTVLAVRVASPH